MIRAIFYKEWIKTKRMIQLIYLFFVAFIGYTFIDIAQMYRLNSAESIWHDIILKDIQLIPEFRFLPLFAGIILALTQHVPEMVNKRFKLTLHLPLSENLIALEMLGYGLLILLSVFGITYSIILSSLSFYFPSEFVVSSLYLSIPWFLGGITSYMFTTWIIYEPVWKYRLTYSLISTSTLMLFFFEGKTGAYLPFVPYLVLIMLISLALPFYSIVRFKDGAQ